MSDDRLPDWPPPPDAPIGEERARAYIAWIRDHVQPRLAEARRMILERYPGATVETAAVTVDQMASWSFHPPMERLSIGIVTASVSGGTWAMVDITITADGQLEARPGWNMR